MQRSRLIATATALLLSAMAALPAQRRNRGEVEPPKLENFYFERWTFDTDHAADGEAGFFIYLPKDYDHDKNKDKSYPWILWLPGFGGPGDFQGRGGATTLDELRGNNEIPDVALVVFRAPGRRGRTTYMDGERIGDIESLITKDLIAHVEKKFRLSKKREQRAVMGVSAGGFGAMKIAMRHPDKFGAVAVHSAAILPGDPEELAGVAESMVMRYLRGGIAEQLGDPIEKDKWQQHMPMGLVAVNKPEAFKGLQIYFDAGTDDHYGFFEPNQELSKAMKQHGHKHLFREVDEGGHAWSSHKMTDNLKHSLRFVGLALSGKNAIEETAKQAAPKTEAGK